MKILKRLQGEVIDLEFEKIRDYKKYSLYQVYKVVNGEKIKLYKQCYNDFDLKEIGKQRNIISEEMYEL